MTIHKRTAPTAAKRDCATVFVAIELSRSSWVVAVHTPPVDKVGLHKLAAGDVEGLLALIARQRARAEKALGRPVRVASCYEAGYDAFWLHRVLVANAVDNQNIRSPQWHSLSPPLTFWGVPRALVLLTL